ncbi:MAG: hypothetical protein ACT4OD_02850 [Candidatus Nitrosotenuis sp.]
MLGLGNNLNELKMRIKKAHEELANLGEPSSPLAEMISTTNILRLNEYLTKTDTKKTDLISDYIQYTKQLEQIVAMLFSIQTELKDLLKTEASMIDSSDIKPKKSKRSATKKTQINSDRKHRL